MKLGIRHTLNLNEHGHALWQAAVAPYLQYELVSIRQTQRVSARARSH